MTSENTVAPTHDELEARMQACANAKDWKGVRETAKLLDDHEKGEVTRKRDEAKAVINETTGKIRTAIDRIVDKAIEQGHMEVCDGVWYSRDFGETESTCRLVRSVKTTRQPGTGGGSGSYVAVGIPTKELLAREVDGKMVADLVMFENDTEVVIDKVKQTVPAGMTYNAAYQFSSNGGWRNRVVMAIRKKAGVI